MTVSYTSEVANSEGFGSLWKLLFRWRGSIYKLVWRDLLTYTICFYALSFTYRFGLGEFGRRRFEEVSLYMQYFTDLIPIAFVLGFYVSIVVQRWWAQFENLPWPDNLSLHLTTFLTGNDDKSRMMRRTIVRYANLSFVRTLVMISPRAKKRFPSVDHLVEAGLLTRNEKIILENTQARTQYSTQWMSLIWAGAIVSEARKEGRIRDDFAVKTIIDELNRLRGICGSLIGYDWISVPLVYTQVVTLAVYTFFVATLMGRQFLDPDQKYEKHHLDLYFPVFTYLQLFFYIGWLKVAESLLNPFGEDDDDFEVNWLIDRNVQVGYLIVDGMHNEHPELSQDIYWDEVFPVELPYTVASQEFRMEPPLGSTANIEVSKADQEILPALEEMDESCQNDAFDSFENMERGKEFSTDHRIYRSGRMKRTSSNFKSILSNMNPRATVRNFLGSNNLTVRRTRARLPSTLGKSSCSKLGPGRICLNNNREGNSNSSREILDDCITGKARRMMMSEANSGVKDDAISINLKNTEGTPFKRDANAAIDSSQEDKNSLRGGSNQQAEITNANSFSSMQTFLIKDEDVLPDEKIYVTGSRRCSS